jgi:signal transduction histidine kinase
VAELNSPGTLGGLLALLAHDLRNPLSALHSNVGFLETTLAGQDQDSLDALSDIGASCSSLKHIIDNLELLGLAVLGERPALELSPLSLWDVTHEAVHRLEPIARSYGASVVFEADRKLAPRVLGHREMFGRALGNVLFNSIQNGGSSGEIQVRLALGANEGIVQITDAGQPLAENLRRSAFTADGQLSCKGDSKGRYSRGLGLFAAATAAGLSGAEIRSAPHPERNVFEILARLA